MKKKIKEKEKKLSTFHSFLFSYSRVSFFFFFLSLFILLNLPFICFSSPFLLLSLYPFPHHPTSHHFYFSISPLSLSSCFSLHSFFLYLSFSSSSLLHSPLLISLPHFPLSLSSPFIFYLPLSFSSALSYFQFIVFFFIPLFILFFTPSFLSRPNGMLFLRRNCCAAEKQANKSGK